METIISLLILGTTMWVGLDASRLMKGIPRDKRKKMGGGQSPAGWVMGCILLWIIVFPWYLRKRSRYIGFHKAKYREEYERLKAEGIEPPPPQEPEAFRKAGFPVATYAILGINFLLWAIMSEAGGSTHLLVLLRFGAQQNCLVAGGQYWRLFTAMFLHIGLEHLLVNSLALLLFGRIVESMYGRGRFLAIYLISGYFGNLLFLAFGQPAIVSVGASGAVFGILGAHLPLNRSLKKRRLFGIRRPALAGVGYIIWIFLRSVGPGVNIFAHLGGLVTGVALGFALYPTSLTSPEQQAVRPSEARIALLSRAALIAAILLLLTVWSDLTSSARKSPAAMHLQQGVKFVLRKQYPQAIAELRESLRLHPKQALAHYLMAGAYAMADRPREAVRSLRVAVSLDASFRQAARTDPVFETIRATDAFQGLVNR